MSTLIQPSQQTGSTLLPRSNQKIVVIQLGDIGDVVLTLPCLESIKAHFTGCSLAVIVRDKAKDLLSDCQWVDEVYTVSKERRPFIEGIKYHLGFIATLRKSHFTIVMDMRTGTRGAFLTLLSGAPHRIGYYADKPFWRNRIYNHLSKIDYVPSFHVIDFHLSLLAAYNIPAQSREPVLDISNEKLFEIPELLSETHIDTNLPFAVIQPFSLWPYKELKEERYVQLINWLSQKCGQVIITGGPGEEERAEQICRKTTGQVFNLAGKTSLSRYAALLKLAKFFVGVDSAGLHIAAAVGSPTAGIFGPSSAVSWAPLGDSHIVISKKGLDCMPCRQTGCDGSHISRCLDDLSLGEITDTLEPWVAAMA